MFVLKIDDLERRLFARVTSISLVQLFVGCIIFVSFPGIVADAQDWIVIKSKSNNQGTSFRGLHGVTRDDQAILIDSKMFQNVLPIRNVEMNILNKDKKYRGTVVGTTNTYSEKFHLKLTKGRFLTDNDTTNRESVAVIGKQLAVNLFGDAEIVGSFVRVNKNYFEIVGIVDSSKPVGTVKVSQSLIIPITTMKSRLGDQMVLRTAGSFNVRECQLSELHVRVKKSVNYSSSRKLIERILKTNHSKKDYEVIDHEK